MSETDRQRVSGAGAAVMVDQSMLLVGHRAGSTGQTARTGHLAPASGNRESGVANVGRTGPELGGGAYHAWGWPVTQYREEIRLLLNSDVSAIAIPIGLSAGVTRELTARHCAPAVLAHPGIPEHHLVLAGERFEAPLPWPPGVYQVDGPLTLPPTMTADGPITWVQPPSRDSLRLSREIDVFGALRAVLDD